MNYIQEDSTLYQYALMNLPYSFSQINSAFEKLVSCEESYMVSIEELRKVISYLLPQTKPSPSTNNNWNKYHGYAKIHRKRYKHEPSWKSKYYGLNRKRRLYS